MTGESGALTFSRPMTLINAVNVNCVSDTRCEFSGIAAPQSVLIVADFDGYVEITLLDSNGDLDDVSDAG